jgi:hypothetical protein
MATLGTNVLTLADIKSRQDPNGMMAKIVEVLNQENGIIDDIPWLEGNLPMGNQTTMRTSIPAPGIRGLNSGVAPGKSSTKQVVDTCCILEANSEVDKDIMKRANDPAGFRLQEDLAYAEGFRESAAKYLFYGDTNADPEQFNGLAVRFNSLAGAVKGNAAYQIVDAGGAGATNTSVWLVNWHEDVVTGIFPKGSNAGLNISDKGEQRVLDAAGNPFYAYCTNMQWQLGLAVKNFKGISRIANIDTTTSALANLDIVSLIINAKNKIPTSLMKGNSVLYVNDAVYNKIELSLINKNNVYITRQELMGKAPVLYVAGIPIKKCDALLSTESRIV